MKRFLKEVALPAGLWIYFLVKGVLMGREVAHRDLQPLEALPAGPFAVILCFCLLMGFAFPFLNAKLQSARLDRFLERIFGQGSYAILCRRLNANLLAGVFFAAVAAAGLFEAARTDAPGVNRQLLQSLFAIPAGIGLAVTAKRVSFQR